MFRVAVARPCLLHVFYFWKGYTPTALNKKFLNSGQCTLDVLFILKMMRPIPAKFLISSSTFKALKKKLLKLLETKELLI